MSHTCPALGQRTGSYREHRKQPNQRALSARVHPARIDCSDQRSEHRARRRGDRRQRHALTALSSSIRAHGAGAAPGDTFRQLHQGTRRRDSAAHDGSDWRCLAKPQVHSARGSAQWPVICQGSRARRSDGRDRGIRRRRSDARSAASIQRFPLSRLYQRRRDRGGIRRRAEEHHRHRRRHLRRASASATIRQRP